MKEKGKKYLRIEYEKCPALPDTPTVYVA